MNKLIKFINGIYLSSTSIMHNKHKLSDILHPIGSLFISTIDTNPSIFYGGVWESFGAGRCLIGVDTSQAEFNTALKTGGSKYLQQHSHQQSLADNGSRQQVAGYSWIFSNTGRWYEGVDLAGNVVSSVQTGNSGNLPPYITVFIWRRIS